MCLFSNRSQFTVSAVKRASARYKDGWFKSKLVCPNSKLGCDAVFGTSFADAELLDVSATH